MNYIDPFGLKEKKARNWWQFWKSKNKPHVGNDDFTPKTNVVLSDIKVIPKKQKSEKQSSTSWRAPSWAYWQPGGLQMHIPGANGYPGVYADHTENIGNIEGLLYMTGYAGNAMGPYSPPALPAAEIAVRAKGISDEVKSITSDAKIKPDNTDKSGWTANVEKLQKIEVNGMSISSEKPIRYVQSTIYEVVDSTFDVGPNGYSLGKRAVKKAVGIQKDYYNGKNTIDSTVITTY